MNRGKKFAKRSRAQPKARENSMQLDALPQPRVGCAQAQSQAHVLRPINAIRLKCAAVELSARTL